MQKNVLGQSIQQWCSSSSFTNQLALKEEKMADKGLSKKLKNKEEPDDSKSFTPRDYQIEILEYAKEQNTIACLGTGTGKTFIAVMLIREMSNEVRKPFVEGGKRIFFLVPTVPLVTQQTKTIKDHTDLEVNGYYGEMDVDSWSKDDWMEQFKKSEVLVMTAEIFRIIVHHSFIPLTQIQLLIFDECHRAQGEHPYREAMKCFVGGTAKQMPRIFGLSASLLNGKCKPTKLEKNLKDLEMTLQSTIITASDILDLQKYGTDPDEYIVLYSKYEIINSGLLREVEVLVQKMALEKSNIERNNAFMDDNLFFDKPVRCLKSLHTTLNDLGPWCACRAADTYIKEVEAMLNRPFAVEYMKTLKEVLEFLKYFSDMCKCLDNNSNGTDLDVMPSKLNRLLGIFLAARRSKMFQSEPVSILKDITFEQNPEKYYSNMKKENEKKQSINLCSIVFVQQRITAYILYQWLLEIKKSFNELEFLEPEFVVGHGTMGISETSMSEKLQQKKLKNFREKKNNVLVATQVLEEGMDITQCNLVVRFDLPGDFRSYVQSKGRARAKNSIYVMLLEQSERYEKFMIDLCNFKTIEKMLQSKCHEREMPTEEEITSHMADEAIPPYMPRGSNGPRISMSAAISLINRYCSTLPSDMATKLVPQWTIKVVDEDDIKKEFQCSLRMPINSPLREIIESDSMRQKKLAKMSAALKACKLLDEIGELNEDLVPISHLVDDALKKELGEVEEEDGKGAIPGTNRRRQVYNKRVPVFFQGGNPKPGVPCYLNILDMKLIIPLSKMLNPRGRPLFNPEETSRGLAVVTTKKLPIVNSFPLFTKSGKILVTVIPSDNPFTLTEQNIQDLEEFHRFIFSDALWIEGSKEFLPSDALSSYYISPVHGGQIDWDFINATRLHPYNNQKLKTKKTIDRAIFDVQKFTNSILMRSYKIDSWKTERPTFHHVVKICQDLKPNSPFECDSKYKTFQEYYLEKYDVLIQNLEQPLIETVQLGGLHMWKPIYLSVKETFDEKSTLSKSKQKRKNFREYLVPELTIIHPFPSDFFFKVMCLPTILFRLNGLLLAEEIRQSVALEAHVGTIKLPENTSWKPFHLETSDKELTDYLFQTGELNEKHDNKIIPCDIIKDFKSNKINSFEVKIDLKTHIGPSPSLILQALTSKSTGDEFDLERLEIIGDSFLKYAMSVKVYIKYFNFDEGRLTRLRSGVIQNLHLYQQAKKKNLGEYLTTTCFRCNSTWLPPCYVIEDHVDEKNVIKKTKKQQKKDQDMDIEQSDNPLHLYFTKQVISDKCVADSVEALIGSYLLSSGQLGALRFMAWLGLNPFAEEVTNFDFNNWPPPPPNPIVGSHPAVDSCLQNLTSGFDRFENIIKYKFINKAYLLQAFTHPSYSYNVITDCYQRLEFLGDSVLDYLITRQLYEDPKDHSPGKLTDLRSALVNNVYFASLAVRHKYHDFLKMLSPSLFRLMNDYIVILQESEAYKFFETHLYYLEEIECFDLEEVEVPKALGDVFESVAGAIYLDSGMSLDAVWKVYYPMIKPALEHLSEHVPLSPVRELFELVKKKEDDELFGESVIKNDKTYIEVTLPNGKRFQGVGPNKKVAKKSAAKRVLAYLKSSERMDTSE
ncbi:endoribonuclease Dicer [Trichonephila clavata]|uniref:Endoribonuclease Dicer n=1 Tax=Trichonephila clavata TaxID=2740835 RepID=A0A8X6GZB5_TRICU|nr:endoribonuclease Dicer [Trichonephila clavata]